MTRRAYFAPHQIPTTTHCTPHCMSNHQHRLPTANACPTCTRRLYTWAGPGHPMPHHYQAIPGVGAWCHAPTSPASHPVPTQG